MSKTKNIPANKFGGKHTSLIPTAKIIVNFLAKSDLVKNISPGIISSYRGKNGSRKHIKISNDESSILITVTDNSNNQKIRIYLNESDDMKIIKTLLIKKSKEKGFTTS